MIPTSSKLLLQVVAGLEMSTGPARFERVQKAVAYANEAMPITKQAGLVAETHELQQVIKQTVELDLLFKYDGRYMLTEEGRNVLSEQS